VIRAGKFSTKAIFESSPILCEYLVTVTASFEGSLQIPILLHAVLERAIRWRAYA